MTRVLVAAGIYNLFWGSFVILFPGAMFGWLNMEAPRYPQLWQCIGMIVGVYGLGYLIASRDPVRHWPIVFVGFLGKILGPLGMAQALWTGALPIGFAVNVITNDLIWWIPFFLILRHVWHLYLAESPGNLPLPQLLAETRTNTGETVLALSEQSPLLTVFLRHSGCTFCREALADLAEQRSAIESTGVRILLVHMGDPQAFAQFAGRYRLGDLPAVSDPERRLYAGLGLRRGRLSQLLGWGVWVRGAGAFFSGHGVGKLEGDGLQMPGVFLLNRGQVVRSHPYVTAADRPDYTALARHLPA